MGDDDLAERVRQAIERHGVSRVARALGLSAEATCRISGRLPTQAGTRKLVESNIGRLAELDSDQDGEQR
jgi:hypothetical protein